MYETEVMTSMRPRPRPHFGLKAEAATRTEHPCEDVSENATLRGERTK